MVEKTNEGKTKSIREPVLLIVEDLPLYRELLILLGAEERSYWDLFRSTPLEEVRGDPYSEQGSGGPYLPLSSIPYGSSPHFLNRKRGGLYLKRPLFGNSPFKIVMELEGGCAPPLVYKSGGGALLFLSSIVGMAEGQLIMSKDLDGYRIPANIILSTLASHETSRDHRPGYLCLSEHMLRAGVLVPLEFGVAEVLWAFHVSPARVTLHSVKIIQTMAWFCEHRGYSADRYPWRELLISVDPPVLLGGRLMLVSIDKGVLPLVQDDALHRGGEGEEACSEDAPKPSPIEGSLTGIDRVDIGRASFLQESVNQLRSEGTISPSKVREELEASRTEVARLHLLLRGGGARVFIRSYYRESQGGRPLDGDLSGGTPAVVLKRCTIRDTSVWGIAYIGGFLGVGSGVAYSG
ncbi:hypothetical protein ACLOJK_023933 [Asimina triloba]